MNERLSPDTIAAAETDAGLEEWEAEGGASLARASDVPSSAVANVALLELLGDALVKEWSNMPMPLRRAVYRRAVGGNAPHGRVALKRQMARFLHDRKRPNPR